MALLEIFNRSLERRVVVTLSRRNLLALLHKLDMPGSAREIDTFNSYENGTLTPEPGHANGTGVKPTRLVVRSEDDEEHYANRPAPGPMHPYTERFIERHGRAKGNE